MVLNTMKKKEQYIYELSISSGKLNEGHSEILKQLFVKQGISFDQIIELTTREGTILSAYLKDAYKARRIKRNLLSCSLKNVVVMKKRLRKQDWQTLWKRNFKPLWLSSGFRVVPAWLKGNPKYNKKTSIFIDTSVAFGTGMHATTRYMVQLIEKRSGSINKFLDVGTGTGILAVAAFKCGAKTIDAVDISNDAVKIARANFLMNDCQPRMVKAVNLMKLGAKAKYDFVAANLMTDELIKHSKHLVALVERSGYLAMSGISEENLYLIKQEFKPYPLKCVRQLKGEGWSAVLYKKACL